MKQIPLHGKYGKGKFALVDDEDHEYLSQFRWNVDSGGYVVNIHRTVDGFEGFKMHRLVMKVTDPSIKVDHKFHNKLDNRKRMLRICTNQQIGMNRLPNKNSISKYKGVTQNRHKWRARIKFNGKLIEVGTFNTEEEAALAYNEKAVELFHEYAKLNVLKGGESK